MLIHERAKEGGMKELKVSIPVAYHLRLRTLKVVEKRQIHAVVIEALDEYFASLRAEQDAARPLAADLAR